MSGEGERGSVVPRPRNGSGGLVIRGTERYGVGVRCGGLVGVCRLSEPVRYSSPVREQHMSKNRGLGTDSK